MEAHTVVGGGVGWGGGVLKRQRCAHLGGEGSHGHAHLHLVEVLEHDHLVRVYHVETVVHLLRTRSDTAVTETQTQISQGIPGGWRGRGG